MSRRIWNGMEKEKENPRSTKQTTQRCVMLDGVPLLAAKPLHLICKWESSGREQSSEIGRPCACWWQPTVSRRLPLFRESWRMCCASSLVLLISPRLSTLIRRSPTASPLFSAADPAQDSASASVSTPKHQHCSQQQDSPLRIEETKQPPRADCVPPSMRKPSGSVSGEDGGKRRRGRELRIYFEVTSPSSTEHSRRAWMTMDIISPEVARADAALSPCVMRILACGGCQERQSGQ